MSEDLVRSEGSTRAPLVELDSGDEMLGEEPQTIPDPKAFPIVETHTETFPRAKREHTIMVYMVGSDLETQSGCASLDLQEMLSARFNSSTTNVVVFTGGSMQWHSSIPNDRNCVIDIANGSGTIIAATDCLLPMGHADTLASFVRWADENVPAQQMGLVLWDHGAGPSVGFGFDEVYDNDSLTLEEMARAMDASGYGAERRLDWVGFDACLMSSYETLLAWRAYADYFVGSEEPEDAYGWSYAFLDELAQTADAAQTVRAVVSSFDSRHRNDPDARHRDGYTLTAIDLARFEDVAKAFEGLCDVALDDFDAGDFAPLARAHAASRQVGSKNEGVVGDLIDLKELAKGLEASHPEEAQRLVDALEGSIMAHSTNVGRDCGVSVGFSKRGDGRIAATDGSSYGHMLDAFARRTTESKPTTWTLKEPKREGDELLIALDDAQMKNLASASYTVLLPSDSNYYFPLVCEVRIEPDEHGVLRIPSNPAVVVFGDDRMPIHLRQTDASPERQSYTNPTPSLSLHPAEFYLRDAYSYIFDFQCVSIALSVDSSSGEVSVNSVSRWDTMAALNGRTEVDVSDYKVLAARFSYGCFNTLVPARSPDGALLPYSQWKTDTGQIHILPDDFEGELTFRSVPVSDLGEGGFAQVVITDLAGDRHGSELIWLCDAQPDGRTVEKKIEGGTLTFRVDGKEAQLVGLEGEPEEVVVPGQVEGATVTSVGDNAIANNYSIRSITLPSTVASIGESALHDLRKLEHMDLGEGLVSIGARSLAGCPKLTELALPSGLARIGRRAMCGLSVTRMHLPASLEELGEAVFAGCQSLEDIDVEKGCEACTSIDGVLFSTDHSTLLAFPAGRVGSYVTPAGVRRIAYGAFAGTSLDDITVTEGVTDIDNCAFLEPVSLSSITLPESLQRLGGLAFGKGEAMLGTDADDPFSELPFVKSVHLGANLTELGEAAFSGLRVGAFTVDEQNSSYSSVGGYLTNKAGDSIVEVPLGSVRVHGTFKRHLVIIPEGITCIDADRFKKFPETTEYVLPDSLSLISMNAFVRHVNEDGLRTSACTIHCRPDTAVDEFAKRHKVSCDHVTDPNLLVSESVIVEQGDLTLAFDVYADHATLVGVEGEEVRMNDGVALCIPQSVSEVPVTGIGDLTKNHDVRSAYIPLEFVELPTTLQDIDPHSISSLRSREGFRLDGESAQFSVVDGELFTASGRRLVAYGHALRFGDKKAYEIPKGTKEIGPYAFCGSNLEEVRLPDSVTSVGDSAFAHCSSLASLSLNEGLMRLGNNALKGDHALKGLTLPSTLRYLGDSCLGIGDYGGISLPDGLLEVGYDVLDGAYRNETYSIGKNDLHIGASLERLGRDALSSFAVANIVVDEQNEHFCDLDGLLASKDGKTLLLCGAARSGVLHIPDGVERLEPRCLKNATQLTDVYVPDSVLAIGDQELTNADAMTIHCSPHSAAAAWATQAGLTWTDSTSS